MQSGKSKQSQLLIALAAIPLFCGEVPQRNPQTNEQVDVGTTV
jgi:hypothetical protein